MVPDRTGQISASGHVEFMTRTKTILYVAGMIVLTAVILFLMGREVICKCGYVKLWHGVVLSSENSQHLFDWYTPTHVLHGFAFYWLAVLVMKNAGLGTRLSVATFVESAWEIVENTDWIINRYREVTISYDYFGDSVINSVADIGAMIAGFLIAARVPVLISVLIFLASELILAWIIRDGLILNIIMLIYPMDFIRDWQAGL